MSTIVKPRIWDLRDILPADSGPEFEAEKIKLQDNVEELKSMEGMLSPQIPTEDFIRALKSYNKICADRARFTQYALLNFRQNTNNQVASAFQTQMDNLAAEVTNNTFFFEYWLINLDNGTRNRLMEGLNPDYRYYVETLEQWKPHTLELEVEKQREIDEVTGIKAWIQHHEKKVGKLQFTFQIDGKKRTLNERNTVGLFYSRNPKERVVSYRSWLRGLAKISDELGDIYTTVIQDWHNENIERRHFKTPISSFNLENEIPDEVTNLVLETCRENVDIFWKFFSLKAKMLGMKKMSRYHIYAPLARLKDEYTYSDTVKLVFDVFDSFDSRLGDMTRRLYEVNHVDAENRDYKYAGAYCEDPNPSILPYISYIHNDTLDSVLSNVHETGHAIQAILANKHPHLIYHPQVPVAEIASGFPELLLFDKLKEAEEDPQIKKDLLVLMLNRYYKGIPRQAYFTIFERDAHDTVGKNVTVKDLGELYLSLLKEQFGNSVYVPEIFQWEFLGIPHIYHAPFYCGFYSFANLTTLSLYNQFKMEGESFKPKFIQLIAYGGSKSPEDMLYEVGIDMSSRDFWQGGFNIIGGMVKELQEY